MVILDIDEPNIVVLIWMVAVSSRAGGDNECRVSRPIYAKPETSGDHRNHNKGYESIGGDI